MLRLHDTAIGRVVDFEPARPGVVSLYVCGPTVYDVPHIGHGRAVLVYDILRRYLEWSGYDVRHVSNVTDVDDHIVERAAQEQRSAEEVARDYEQAHWDAMDRLGAKRPTDVPHATGYIDDMIELIGELVERGVAYETATGVYFSAEKVDGYGLLARQSLDSLRAGARVVVDETKRSPVDFVLWKPAKAGEPSWPSPWGDGRPGWHTECVVMSLDLLGEDFDLHTGGLDLQFPHHENERAQAVALGRRFARHWMHHAFVEVGGEKMSKSLRNFTSLVDLLERYPDARAYRLLVLRSHYRSPLEATPETMEQAKASVERLDDFVRRVEDEVDVEGGGRTDTAALPAVVEQFRRHMDDDLDTPAAIAVVFDAVRQGNAALDQGDPALASSYKATVIELAGALGLVLGGGGDDVDDESAALRDRRDEARAARDWAAADALRTELEARGWVVEDTPSGTRLHR